jgi:SAM-dependent methyltransferase
MTKPFIDLYSNVAANYVARPHYPQALFQWLAEQAPATGTAWDCACGSGQASHDLAHYFDQVISTDASGSQIKLATPNSKIEFRQAAAEVSELKTGSVDLINVGMAAHWFDLPAFYAEAKRVAKPDALLALWVYGEPQIDNPQVNEQVQDFIARMNHYSVPERKYVEALYENLPFPFTDELKLPPMHMQADMTLPQLRTYLRSRSPRGLLRFNAAEITARIFSISPN